ncbi:MAG: putative MPP superfamily phosphohydrolase [Cellvibrionaceae bacterium]|jgi:predicted MPP superfamily phosphohydrolase
MEKPTEVLKPILEKLDKKVPTEEIASQHTNAGMFVWLTARFGEDYLRKRLQYQIVHADEIFDRGRRLLYVENSEWIMVFLYWALKLLGLYGRGNRNFLDIQTVENDVYIENLPDAFDGYRLLQLSDLHLDIDLNLRGAIERVVKPVDYDLALITGDYRASTSGSYRTALDETAELMKVLKKPIYSILGNHDFIEFVQPLEDIAGMTFLINESLPLEKDGDVIWLSGIDDPHMYKTDNLNRTYAGVPPDAVKILMSHSPETWKEAAAHGVDFMLSGHTHAGQICLPGGIPLIVHAKCPREMISGNWHYEGVHGYTSPGSGGCGVPVRFNCPPEITIHTLRKKL